MVLKTFQATLELGRLYEVSQKGPIQGVEQKEPNIFINSGGVNIYGSNSATEPTALSQMALTADNTNVEGQAAFGFIPRYIAITQNTGMTTELVVSGLQARNVGPIS